MEPNNFEVITTKDKDKRDRMFQEFRNSTEPNERQAVKFSSADGWSVAYPTRVEKQNHGSKRNPRKFPPRKDA